MKKITFLILSIFCVAASFANIRLPKLFGDSMVLQRGMPIPVWGWADKNEKVSVHLGNQTKTAVAGQDGRWRINLDKLPAGGPYQLTVKGNNQVVIKHILIGDVWLCSGQSNMEFKVNGVINAAKEIATSQNINIRHIYIPKAVSGTPESDLAENTSWQAATPGNTGNFTAVGYFFARELYKDLKIPIGLIHSSWGGTDVEPWTSRQGMESSDEFRELMKKIPSVNLDSLAARNQQQMKNKLQTWQGGLPVGSAVEAWKELSFDDANWKEMKVPSLWETQGLQGLDGVAWFRKEITLSAAEAGKTGQIDLSMIDDNDETYLNGIKVGGLTGYNLSRSYKIPPNVLKEGKNVIAVRINDTGGGGGLYGEAADMKLTVGQEIYPLAGQWKYRIASVTGGSMAVGPNSYPTLLFNAMINPLIPFAIKGAIWYQGENNASRAYQYRKAFPLMITDWRNHWKEGNFPFYFVQLASFNASNGTSAKGSAWAELREAQTLTLALPNTGMAVTTDIGTSNDIHPKNKQDVGKRLAAIALHDTYGKDNVYSGPVYQSMKAEGNKILLNFSQTGSGLKIKDGNGNLKGFEIAGADEKFYLAKATLRGNQVIVMADSVAQPVAVRYAWADDAGEANLFNKEGFPAGPFRTDKWKGITEAVKYSK